MSAVEELSVVAFGSMLLTQIKTQRNVSASCIEHMHTRPVNMLI